jgi:hypothetical protein
MTTQFLVPGDNPPSMNDYQSLYAQFIALIVSRGLTEQVVPHVYSVPYQEGCNLMVAKEVDDANQTTTYKIVHVDNVTGEPLDADVATPDLF